MACGCTRDVANVFIHPDFGLGEPVHNDMALLKLTKRMYFNRNVQPALLPTAEITSSEYLYLCGWGSTSTSDTGLLDICLRRGNVNLVSRTVCSAIYADDTVGADMICVGKTGATGKKISI